MRQWLISCMMVLIFLVINSTLVGRHSKEILQMMGVFTIKLAAIATKIVKGTSSTGLQVTIQHRKQHTSCTMDWKMYSQSKDRLSKIREL